MHPHQTPPRPPAFVSPPALFARVTARRALRHAHHSSRCLVPFASMRTLTHTWTDPRDVTHQIPVQVLDPVDRTPVRPSAPPLVFIHIAGGPGVDMHYWDPVWSRLHLHPTLRRHPCVRFDWASTGVASPKPFAKHPYSHSYFASQLSSLLRECLQVPSAILIAASGAELVALSFAQAHSPQLHGLLSVGGASTTAITSSPDRVSDIVYRLFTTPFGILFWSLLRRPSFLSAFSRKNLLISDVATDSWVHNVSQGMSDKNSRFVFFSFAARMSYCADFLETLSTLQCPYAYLGFAQIPKRSVALRWSSLRPPVPGSAGERPFSDDARERLSLRRKLLPDAYTQIVQHTGPEMMFEQPDIALPALVNALSHLFPASLDPSL